MELTHDDIKNLMEKNFKPMDDMIKELKNSIDSLKITSIKRNQLDVLLEYNVHAINISELLISKLQLDENLKQAIIQIINVYFNPIINKQ